MKILADLLRHTHTYYVHTSICLNSDSSNSRVTPLCTTDGVGRVDRQDEIRQGDGQQEILQSGRRQGAREQKTPFGFVGSGQRDEADEVRFGNVL